MTPRRVVSDEPLMSLADVAAQLGVPVKTFRSWREHHYGPRGYKIGNRVQYRWSEVDAWLQAQREQFVSPSTVTPLRRHA